MQISDFSFLFLDKLWKLQPKTVLNKFVCPLPDVRFIFFMYLVVKAKI